MRIAALALAALPATALAQMGNPGFMSPATRFDPPGVPAPGQTNTTDQLFVLLVGEGGVAEVALGELAGGKAADQAVGDFARRMVDDHKAANERLVASAKDGGMPVPDALSPEHEAMKSELAALDGAAFDLAYMRGQIVDHQKTVQLLVYEIGQGQDAALQQFAASVLPTVLDHLATARGIVSDLSTGKASASGEMTPPPRSE